MMREARGARSLLLRVQTAAWIEHCALGLMAEALGRAPVAPTAEPEPAPVPMPAPAPAPETDDPFALLTEAEQYAVTYPRRAALIRSLGGLPDKCDFGPPAPALVHAIVTGAGPTLRALDLEAAA
jgi:hypothetical protein